MSYLRHKIIRLASYGGGLLALLMVFSLVPAQAASTLSCGSTEDTLGQAVSLVAGEQTTLVCVLKSDRDMSVALIGNRVSPGGETTASASFLDLKAGESVQSRLMFSSTYQNGTYSFAVSLIDTADQSVVKKATLDGILGSATAKQVRILSASVDKGDYQWGEGFALALALDVPEGASLDTDPVSVTVAMQDQAGATCSTIADKQQLTKAEETLSLKFPKVSGTCVNALSLTLQSKDGTILDKRVVPVGLTYKEETSASATGEAPVPGQSAVTEQSGSGLMTFMVAVIGFVVVFAVVFVGYVMVQRKKKSVI